MFKHTTQPLGSTTSPVEDLALEVAEAFEILEQTHTIKPKMLKTFRDAIGNLSLESIQPHGITQSFSEVHSVNSRRSTITLNVIPEQGSVSVSYTKGQDVITLTEVDGSAPFNANNQFKIKGKVLALSVEVPLNQSLTMSVAYRGTTFKLGGVALLSNVVKTTDGVFALTPTQGDSGNKYKLQFDYDLSDNSETIKLNQASELTFFQTTNEKDWLPMDVESYSIDQSIINFTSNTFVMNSNTKVAVFVENVSMAQVLDALYKEFINHNHASDQLTKNVSSYDLANRVISRNGIIYPSDQSPNYQFPQYLNREGHNPHLEDVFENALLGDLFIARQRQAGSQRYKGLDRDSSKIVFGEPSIGHYLKYSRAYQSLFISTVENANGVKIYTADPTKWVLSLNDTVIASNTNGLNIQPQNRILDLKSKNSDANVVKADELQVTTLKPSEVLLNKVKLRPSADGHSATFEAASGDSTKVIFDLPVVFKHLNMAYAVLDSFRIGKVTLAKDSEDNAIVDSTEDKQFIINAPAHLRRPHITAGTVDSLKFGEIELKKTEANGLEIKALDPDVGIKVKSKIELDNAAVSGNLAVGEVTVRKDSDNNMVVESTDNKKTIFKNPVDFLNVTTGRESNINIQVLSSDDLQIGQHKIHVDDNDTAISQVGSDPATQFVIKSKSKLLDTRIEKGHLTNVTADKVKVGNTTIASGDEGVTVLQPTTSSSDKLIIKTSTTVDNLTAEAVTFKQSPSFEAGVMIGNVTLSADDGNLTVVAAENKGVKFTAPLSARSFTATEATINGGTFTGISANNLSFGKVKFNKGSDNDNLVISREGDEAKIQVTVPTHIGTLTVDTFNTLAASNMADLTATKLTLGGVVIESTAELTSVSKVKEDSEVLFQFKLPSKFTTISADRISSIVYKMDNKDKIELDADNYLENRSNRFTVHNTKAFTFVGSGRTTGYAMSYNAEATAMYRNYVAGNAGLEALATEKNVYFEANATKGFYFLQDTGSKISYDGTIYGFNDSTAQQNISDLTQWWRSNLYVGHAEAYSISLKQSDGVSRNGLQIGSTRLSVIGPNTPCPQGLTIFESQEGIHFVKSMGVANDCRNLTYQEISSGALNVKGSATIEGNVVATDDLIVNGAVTSAELVVTSEAEMNGLKLSGQLGVAKEATFTGEAEFKAKTLFSNDVEAKGTLLAKNIEVAGNSAFGRDLEVGRHLNVGGALAIGERLSVKTGIQTESEVKGKLGDFEEIQTHHVDASGTLTVQGQSKLQGALTVDNQSKFGGTVHMEESLQVKGELISVSMNVIKDSHLRGNVEILGNALIQGREVKLGSEDSTVTITGKLSFHTKEAIFNSPVKIFNVLDISGDTTVNGKLINKGGLEVGSSVHIEGATTIEGQLDVGSEVKAKSLLIDGTGTVTGSVIANNFTGESIVIDNTANIANLQIGNSLVMSSATNLTAGAASFSSLQVTDSRDNSSFAGNVSVAGGLEVLKPLRIFDSITFGQDRMEINNAGIDAKEGTIRSNRAVFNKIQGTIRIQPTASMLSSRHSVVSQTVSALPSRQFVEMDNVYVTGLAVFNNPLVVDTLMFKDLIFIGENNNPDLLGIDIVARKAVYA